MGVSVEVKYTDKMMLKPANGIAVKYNFRPDMAISCSCALCSLLNTAAMGSAKKLISR